MRLTIKKSNLLRGVQTVSKAVPNKTSMSILECILIDAREGMITPEFVSQYIDKIFVTVDEDLSARLEIKIFTGACTEKYMQKLSSKVKGRTGHTFKKMIESYENSIKTK